MKLFNGMNKLCSDLRGCFIAGGRFTAWAQFPPQFSERLYAKADAEYKQGHQPKDFVAHSHPRLLILAVRRSVPNRKRPPMEPAEMTLLIQR